MGNDEGRISWAPYHALSKVSQVACVERSALRGETSVIDRSFDFCEVAADLERSLNDQGLAIATFKKEA